MSSRTRRKVNNANTQKNSKGTMSTGVVIGITAGCTAFFCVGLTFIILLGTGLIGDGIPVSTIAVNEGDDTTVETFDADDLGDLTYGGSYIFSYDEDVDEDSAQNMLDVINKRLSSLGIDFVENTLDTESQTITATISDDHMMSEVEWAYALGSSSVCHYVDDSMYVLIFGDNMVNPVVYEDDDGWYVRGQFDDYAYTVEDELVDEENWVGKEIYYIVDSALMAQQNITEDDDDSFTFGPYDTKLSAQVMAEYMEYGQLVSYLTPTETLPSGNASPQFTQSLKDYSDSTSAIGNNRYVYAKDALPVLTRTTATSSDNDTE